MSREKRNCNDCTEYLDTHNIKQLETNHTLKDIDIEYCHQQN